MFSHFGNTENMAEPLHMWRAESPLLLLFLSVWEHREPQSHTRLTEQQSVHLFSSLAACGASSAATRPAWMGPNPGLDPQVAAFKPGLELSTSLVRMGETGIGEVMASSGQGPLCTLLPAPI